MFERACMDQSNSVSAYCGKVDFVFFAIRDDEFRALLQRFPSKHTLSGRREYNLCEVLSADGKRTYLVATMRLVEQGNLESSNAVRDTIADLDPGCICVVGIAGAIATSDLTLGDVVIGTQVYDLTLGAISKGKRTFSLKGGPISQKLRTVVANLRARIGDWNESIGMQAPESTRQNACTGARKSGKQFGQTSLGFFLPALSANPTSPTAPSRRAIR